MHTIGILRECKNKWERRVAITPNEVKKIIAMGIKVIVQSSTLRCYSDDQFIDAGATIQEDMSPASVIFGVKEVPIPDLIANKTYFFFSHTIKAQSYNMGLLDKLLELNIRMVDYECIREPKRPGEVPQRLVAFGRYAGIAGAFDFLRGIGEYLLERKFQTPFVYFGSSYMYGSYLDMQVTLSKISRDILIAGLPRSQCPMVFAVTGNGRVAEGSMEVLTQLPHVKVDPKDLHAFCADPANKKNNKQIVICQFLTQDMVKRMDGKPYEKQDYRNNPHEYTDTFHSYLDCVSWLVNCIYWEAKYPRVLSRDALKKAVAAGKSKLMGVTDISADYEGSVEFTSRFTSIEEPFLLYDPLTMTFKEKIAEFSKDEILFHSVDHLPAEMPKEASDHFGSKLMPFIKQVVNADFNTPWDQVKDLPEEIYNAVIAANGQLTPSYKYIANLRALNERTKKDDNSSCGQCQSFCIQLTGHLFDTKGFNKIIDMCESNGVYFRVIAWELGFSKDEETSVTIQCIHQFEPALDALREEIGVFCKDANIKVENATGPDVDKQILKKIHQDHIH